VVYAEGSGPNPPTGSPATSPAPTPSPSPAGNDGSTAALVAVRLDDGMEEWRTELPSPSRSGVTAADDAVYVGTNDGALTALEASTGAIRWREQVGGTVVAPAAVEGDLVVVTAAGDADAQLVVAALRADDGSTAWRYEPGLGMRIGGPPSIADGAVFVGLEDRTVRAIDLESGSERWSARLNVPSPLTAPAVASEVVLVVDLGGQVYALDGATGERRWDHALNVRVRWSSPVVSGEAVLVASVDGRLFALDLVEGDLLSSLDAADGVLRSLVVGNDRVIAVRSGSEPGLVAFAHDPDGSLVRIASPTIVDPARLAANAALAIVPIVVVLLVLGRWLARRSGPPPLGGTRPRDPIEDALAEDEP
jgi:outer membrane protein assembly factor BamB